MSTAVEPGDTAAPSAVPSTVPLTSFVGRRQELAEARRLLAAARLVTLIGPGGVGKTRLALQLAERVRRDFDDGLVQVELGDVLDPLLVATTVVERLGIQDQSARRAAEVLAAHLADRRLLLVLDNCEHLRDACRQLVAGLLPVCPGVRVLATSRQSLGVAGEELLRLPPLATPDAEEAETPDRLGTYDAVALFVERAAATQPSFRLDSGNAAPIARICRRLDGLPLAIELAAARMRVLSPVQIEQRLDERYRLLTGGNPAAPQRQQTLRALVDWSHDLCSPAERLLWARTSVFAGGFDIEAAQAVCAYDELDPAAVPALLDALADKSVLAVDGGRHRMTETIREYGAARLAASGEEPVVRDRHRDWCAALVDEFASAPLGPAQLALGERLRLEHANLRAALAHCLRAPGGALTGLRIAAGLDDEWGTRGLYAELRHWLGRLLRAAPAPTPERVAGLRVDGWYALIQGDVEAALDRLTEAADLAGRLDAPTEAAYVTLAWGMGSIFSGDAAGALPHLAAALEGFRAVGHLRGELFALFGLGLARGDAGEPERGLALLEECIAASTRAGETFWRAYALLGVSEIEVRRGHLERAGESGRTALALHRDLDNRLGASLCVEALAAVAAQEGQHARAATLFGVAAALWEDIGSSYRNYATIVALHDEHEALVREALGAQELERLRAAGRATDRERGIDLALGVEPSARPAAEPGPLTRRESEVAALVAEGLTNRELAARLGISPRTADVHVQRILHKLGFTSRTQVAAWFDPG